MADRCEWNPRDGCAAIGDDGCKNEAKVSVGANGFWHLCEDCAELPFFRRFKKRTHLAANELRKDLAERSQATNHAGPEAARKTSSELPLSEKRIRAAARVMCAAANDDWRRGKSYWMSLAEQVLAASDDRDDLREAAAEVMRISDRDHEAWHRLRDALRHEPDEALTVRIARECLGQAAVIVESFTDADHISADIKAGIFPKRSDIRTALAAALRDAAGTAA